MNDFTLQSIASDLVPPNYLSVANNARVSRDKLIKILLEKVRSFFCFKSIYSKVCSFLQKKLPDSGWDNCTIEYLVAELALLDSNNFPSRCGVGEREARVVCGNCLKIIAEYLN